MNKPNVKGLIRGIRVSLDKHAPEILTGMGIAGMVTCVVLAVKATPKAIDLIEEAKGKKPENEEFTVVDTVKSAWRPYVPAAVIGTASVACLIGGQSVSARRTAALAAAYQLSETALKEYKEAVIEEVGERKVKDINEKAAQKLVDRTEIDESKIIVTGQDDILCIDPLSNRTFMSNPDKIQKAVNEFNRKLTYEVYMSVNDFYSELDNPNLTSIRLGEDVGWEINRQGLVEVRFDSALTKDKKPVLVMELSPAPDYGYDRI